MQFTFGIVTDGGSDQLVEEVIDSIEQEGIPGYEVIVVGNSDIDRKRTKVIPFDEEEKVGWITKKKNIITKAAKYSKIVYMHDYIALCGGWYEGMLEFGSRWDLCMTRVYNFSGERFRDWCLSPVVDLPPNLSRCRLLPYNIKTGNEYISGGYWIGKKLFMLDNPLDESLVWGDSEDVEWSSRVIPKAGYVMNPLSAARCLRMKRVSFTECGKNVARMLND